MSGLTKITGGQILLPYEVSYFSLAVGEVSDREGAAPAEQRSSEQKPKASSRQAEAPKAKSTINRVRLISVETLLKSHPEAKKQLEKFAPDFYRTYSQEHKVYVQVASGGKLPRLNVPLKEDELRKFNQVFKEQRGYLSKADSPASREAPATPAARQSEVFVSSEEIKPVPSAAETEATAAANIPPSKKQDDKGGEPFLASDGEKIFQQADAGDVKKVAAAGISVVTTIVVPPAAAAGATEAAGTTGGAITAALTPPVSAAPSTIDATGAAAKAAQDDAIANIAGAAALAASERSPAPASAGTSTSQETPGPGFFSHLGQGMAEAGQTTLNGLEASARGAWKDVQAVCKSFKKASQSLGHAATITVHSFDTAYKAAVDGITKPIVHVWDLLINSGEDRPVTKTSKEEFLTRWMQKLERHKNLSFAKMNSTAGDPILRWMNRLEQRHGPMEPMNTQAEYSDVQDAITRAYRIGDTELTGRLEAFFPTNARPATNRETMKLGLS